MALRVLLADAELETVPGSIASHPAVKKAAQAVGKRPEQMLLDQNHHRPAMAKLEDGKRRGRPDITHYTLLTLLESPLARAGGLRVAVHTRHGRLIRIREDTRLPRGEARFHGVMARVLQTGASHDKDPLIQDEGEVNAQTALQRFGKGPVLRLDEGGRHATPLQVADQARAGELTLVLGAFPLGDWSKAWQQAAPDAVSIWDDALNAWAVAAELVAAYRYRHGPARPL